MKIAILVCYNPTLINFRLDLMLEMIRLGHQVIAVGNESYENRKLYMGRTNNVRLHLISRLFHQMGR